MSHMSPNYCHIMAINKGCGLIIILHIVHNIRTYVQNFKQLELVVSELWVLEVVDSIKLHSIQSQMGRKHISSALNNLPCLFCIQTVVFI